MYVVVFVSGCRLQYQEKESEINQWTSNLRRIWTVIVVIRAQ